jgi:hypothetical protein
VVFHAVLWRAGRVRRADAGRIGFVVCTRQEEVFEAIKPGFRAYANNPNAAADSLDPLLSVVRTHLID